MNKCEHLHSNSGGSDSNMGALQMGACCLQIMIRKDELGSVMFHNGDDIWRSAATSQGTLRIAGVLVEAGKDSSPRTLREGTDLQTP